VESNTVISGIWQKIGCRWAFRKAHDSFDSRATRYKTRLAKGFVARDILTCGEA